MVRFDLSDFEWSVIQPLLPNKPRGAWGNIRAVATRYDKRDDNYLASIKLASLRIWLRFNESVT